MDPKEGVSPLLYGDDVHWRVTAADRFMAVIAVEDWREIRVIDVVKMGCKNMKLFMLEPWGERTGIPVLGMSCPELQAQRASWPVAPDYDTRIFMGCLPRG